MLPFHKRTPRAAAGDDFEDLNTEDVMEVLRPAAIAAAPSSGRSLASPASVPPPAMSRPRAFHEGSLTDEVTTLMPAKGHGTLPPPPRSVRPSHSVRPASAPVQTFRPQHQGFVHPIDESTRTDYRTLPPPSFPPPRAVLSAMPQPIPQSMIPAAPSSFAAVAYNMSVKSDSDARIDPPATVITTRTKVLTGRPTLSWGAALVAMGIFGGLVTAVLARGDGDALVDATASFVDPAHANKAAGAAETRTSAPMLQSAPAAPIAATSMEAQRADTISVAVAAKPAPEAVAAKPASMAYAHPAAFAQPVEKKAEPKAEAPKAVAAAPAKVAAIKPTWTAPARPQPLPEKVEKAEKPEKADKTVIAKSDKKGPATKDDLASAKEAKALADAQLEASLR